MKNNLHVFLGATVADAAARPLHWVYNQKKLSIYIKGKKDFSFLKKNRSPRLITVDEFEVKNGIERIKANTEEEKLMDQEFVVNLSTITLVKSKSKISS